MYPFLQTDGLTGTDQTDLIVEIKSGLVVSDRHSLPVAKKLPRPWAPQIPVISEKPLCLWFQKVPTRCSWSHDWVVPQITDLLHTTQKVKTQQVVRNRGQERLPRERGGPGAFGVGPPHRPRPFWK